MAADVLGELRWLGIRPTPSYVGEPECNGNMERWIRTLKEECLYLHDLATPDRRRRLMGELALVDLVVEQRERDVTTAVRVGLKALAQCRALPPARRARPRRTSPDRR